jgi:hypothetical protein
LRDEEIIKLLDEDLNNEQFIIHIFTTHIAPHVQTFDGYSQEAIKDTLSYYIKTGNLNLERVFAMFQIPFENPPDDSRNFLKVLWSVLYGDEPIQDNPISYYTIDNGTEFFNSVSK